MWIWRISVAEAVFQQAQYMIMNWKTGIDVCFLMLSSSKYYVYLINKLLRYFILSPLINVWPFSTTKHITDYSVHPFGTQVLITHHMTMNYNYIWRLVFARGFPYDVTVPIGIHTDIRCFTGFVFATHWTHLTLGPNLLGFDGEWIMFLDSGKPWCVIFVLLADRLCAVSCVTDEMWIAKL